MLTHVRRPCPGFVRTLPSPEPLALFIPVLRLPPPPPSLFFSYSSGDLQRVPCISPRLASSVRWRERIGTTRILARAQIFSNEWRGVRLRRVLPRVLCHLYSARRRIVPHLPTTTTGTMERETKSPDATMRITIPELNRRNQLRRSSSREPFFPIISTQDTCPQDATGLSPAARRQSERQCM